MKDSAYKYRYELQQTGPGRIEMFGTDTKLTDDELELKRRAINSAHPRVYVVRLWLVNQKTNRVVARSSNSKLPPLPLFEVVS